MTKVARLFEEEKVGSLGDKIPHQHQKRKMPHQHQKRKMPQKNPPLIGNNKRRVVLFCDYFAITPIGVIL